MLIAFFIIFSSKIELFIFNITRFDAVFSDFSALRFDSAESQDFFTDGIKEFNKTCATIIFVRIKKQVLGCG